MPELHNNLGIATQGGGRAEAVARQLSARLSFAATMPTHTTTWPTLCRCSTGSTKPSHLSPRSNWRRMTIKYTTTWVPCSRFRCVRRGTGRIRNGAASEPAIGRRASQPSLASPAAGATRNRLEGVRGVALARDAPEMPRAALDRRAARRPLPAGVGRARHRRHRAVGALPPAGQATRGAGVVRVRTEAARAVGKDRGVRSPDARRRRRRNGSTSASRC